MAYISVMGANDGDQYLKNSCSRQRSSRIHAPAHRLRAATALVQLLGQAIWAGDPASLVGQRNPNIEAGAISNLQDYGKLLRMQLIEGWCGAHRVLPEGATAFMRIDRHDWRNYRRGSRVPMTNKLVVTGRVRARTVSVIVPAVAGVATDIG